MRNLYPSQVHPGDSYGFLWAPMGSFGFLVSEEIDISSFSFSPDSLSLLCLSFSGDGPWKGLGRGFRGSWKGGLGRVFQRPCEGWRYSGREQAQAVRTTGDRSFLRPTRSRGGGSNSPSRNRGDSRDEAPAAPLPGPGLKRRPPGRRVARSEHLPLRSLMGAEWEERAMVC